MRLLQFSGVLAACEEKDVPRKLSLSFWDNVVKDYFTPDASFKLTLWKENQRLEAKPFGTSLLVSHPVFCKTDL